MPIQLEFGSESFIAAVDNVLLRKSKITSLNIYNDPDRMPLLHQLLMFSRSSVELLHIRSRAQWGWRVQDEPVHELWEDLPSLRELFVHRYSIPINRLAAPKLVHLALEQTGCCRSVTVRSILDLFRDCPLL